MLKVEQAQDRTPSCFGSDFDRAAPECVGGHDPAFQDDSGGHVRPACEMVTTCATRTQATKNSQQLVPASSLIRPPTTFTAPTAPTYPAVRPTYQQPAAAPAAQPYRPPYYQGPSQTYQPPYQPQQPPPYHGLQQMVPVNYGMPQYLTVREPVNGQRMFARLGVEVLRSMGKSFGHTIANFFDSEIFTKGS